jgi:hypothetical protein
MNYLARPYLDSLTTQELALIADDCGIDIPADLDRIFIIEELLDYQRAEEAEQEGEEDLSESPYYPETVCIPRQYNINFIDVMVRDPLWVFAFWEIKEHDRDMFEKNPAFSGCFLRVSPAGEGKAQGDFTVQIEPGDTARYLGFSEYPLEGRGGGCFRVELCAGFEGRWEALAASRIFRLPALQEKAFPAQEGAFPGLEGTSPGQEGAFSGQERTFSGLERAFPGQEGAAPPSLPVLSGLNEFPIIRSADRLGNFRFSGGVR